MAFQSNNENLNPSLFENKSNDIVNKEDKWKAVSHLQKCIRRGWVSEVEQAVRLCYKIDAAYTRYRLSVIAFEDIAGGNPKLIAQSFQKGWSKKIIEELGGEDWLVEQATQWAMGPKDRLASDLGACVYYKSEFEEKYGLFESLSIEKALDIAWSDAPWAHRALALWRAFGTEQYPHPLLPKIKGDVDKVLQKNQELGISEAFNECIRAGSTQKEFAPVFLPLVALGLQKAEPELSVLPLEKNTPIWIGPWVSIALDKHTREGQKALSWAWYHLHWKKEFEALGATQQVALDAIGKMQFWMEGGLLDKTPNYPFKKQVTMESRQNVFATWPFSAKQLYTIAGNVEMWNKARFSVLGLPYPMNVKNMKI